MRHIKVNGSQVSRAFLKAEANIDWPGSKSPGIRKDKLRSRIPGFIKDKLRMVCMLIWHVEGCLKVVS